MSNIFVVTTINNSPRRLRSIAWFSCQDKAMQAVEENWGDMCELGYYKYAVIEELREGLYPMPVSRWLYIWNDTDKNYLRVSPSKHPKWVNDIISFGVG